MTDTTGILTIAYPEIEKNIKSSLSSYKTYISKFINTRHQDMYSNIPSKQMYFSQTDIDSFFKSIHVDSKIIKRAIEATYYADIANFNPRYAKDECTVALLCLIRYFMLKNMKKELEFAIINMVFSGKYYPSIWYASFRVTAPQEHIMEYVITNMCSNKFDIVREGSVIGALKSIAYTWINSYEDRFKTFHDDDCVYLIQQLHNRIRSFMNNIAELYYEAYNNKNIYITYDSDDYSEDKYHLSDSDSLKIERAVTAAITRINTHGVDYRICKMASNDLVKIDELRSIIEVLMSDKNNMVYIKEYITLMVSCFYRDNKGKTINDLSFISYTIKAKPNSKDKYILRQKELLNIILINNSEHFARRRNRNATEQAYYRAINAYFALMVQEANK